MKRIPEKIPDELLATGVFLSLTLLAVFQQLEFALDIRSVGGKDWWIHYFITMQIHARNFDWLQILEFYNKFGHGIGHYPPLAYMVSSIFLLFDQWDTLVALYASRTVFIVVLAGSLYLAGRKLGESPWTGLIAASIGCLNPVILAQTHDILLDFPTAAMVALALCAYAFTENYEKKLPCLVLGIICGMGMLVKPSVLFFLAPFLLFAFLLPKKVKLLFSSNRLQSALLFLVFSAITTSLYYLPQLGTMWTEGSTATVLGMNDFLANILQYARFTAKVFLPGWIVLPVLVLLAYAVWKKHKWPWHYLIATLVSFGFILTLNSESHIYLYPYQVLLALAAAQGMAIFKPRMKRIAGTLLVVLVSIPLINTGPAPELDHEENWPDTIAMHHLFTERYNQDKYEKIRVGSFGHNRVTDLVTVLTLEWANEKISTAFLEKGSAIFNSVQIFSQNHSIGMDEFIRSAVNSGFTVLVRPRGPIPHQDGEEYWNRLMTILNDPAGRHHLDFVYESHPDDVNGCQIYFYKRKKAQASTERNSF